MPASLPDLILDAATTYPERTAIRTSSGSVSFGDLAERIETLAARLASLDLSGERVGVLLPNLPLFPQVFYAVLRAGGSALLLNPLYSAREVAEYLADSGTQTVLTTRQLAGLLPAATRRVLVDDLPENIEVVSAQGSTRLPLDGAALGTPGPRGGEDEAVVVYTAAMRGWARGARLSHANLLANARSTVEAMGMVPEDRVAAALPLIHLFGLTVTLNGPLGIGASVIPVERFHPARLLDLIVEERATVVSGVPAMFMAMIAVAERRGTPIHSLRIAIAGGAPLPREVAERWEELFGLPLREGYGLTEAAPVCLFNRADRPNRVGTLGYPFPGVDVSIRDEHGKTLPQGAVGEICIRGDNVFLGYVGEDGRGPGDFWGDALRTGDLGSADPDGAIRFRGFLKPMFTRNGFNVYPHEVERALMADPHIARATVCALPDAARENEIVLLIQPAQPGALSEEDVRAICAGQLAAFKQPGRILVGEIPPAG